VGGYDAINGTGGVCHVQDYGNQDPGAGEVKPRFKVSRGGPVGYLDSGSGHEEMKTQHVPKDNQRQLGRSHNCHGHSRRQSVFEAARVESWQTRV
jgi:hypothetical protein